VLSGRPLEELEYREKKLKRSDYVWRAAPWTRIGIGPTITRSRSDCKKKPYPLRSLLGLNRGGIDVCRFALGLASLPAINHIAGPAVLDYMGQAVDQVGHRLVQEL
jgi:hypothetical protein